MHLFRPLVLALIPQHHRQVVHARQCGWVLFTQHRLPQPKYLSTSINKFDHFHYCELAELWGLSFCKLDIGQEGSDLERPELVASHACCHLGEHMASHQALQGLDLVHMLILVSKAVFISVYPLW
jgi:hypothetical protein